MREQWRCTQCGKLLGVIEGARLQIRFARGHQYVVGLPATSVCRGCRTLNEVPARDNIDTETTLTRATAQS